MNELGKPLLDPVVVTEPRPVPGLDGSIKGRVLYVDQFGNLITNLRGVNPSSVRVGGRELPVCGAYSSAAHGQLLGLISTEGQLEITMRDGSAAAALQAGPGEPVSCKLARGQLPFQ
jgi:S-adenosylmethionine hydrolase